MTLAADHDSFNKHNKKRKMKIGFDAKRIVHNNTGLGSYARTLVNDLSEPSTDDDAEWRLYAPRQGQRTAAPTGGRQRPTCAIATLSHCPHGLGKWLWRSHGIVADLVADDVDVYHGLSGELPVGISKAGVRSVVTIHDLIFLRHPEYYNSFDRAIYTWKFRRTIAEADRIIAISECTKRDIMFYGNVSPDRISLIYQSCSTFFKLRESEDKLQDVNARYMLPPRYIVCVGTIEERKNVLLAVKALHRLPEELSLVIVGRSTALCRQGAALHRAEQTQQARAHPERRFQRRPARHLPNGRGIRLSFALRRLRHTHHRSHTERTARRGLHRKLS